MYTSSATMSWIPFVPDLEAWKNHFLFSSERHLNPNQKSSIIGQVGSGGITNKIQLVTPTEQAIERAKSEIRRRKKEGEPVITFHKDRIRNGIKTNKQVKKTNKKQTNKSKPRAVKPKNTVKKNAKTTNQRKKRKSGISKSSQKKTFFYKK